MTIAFSELFGVIKKAAKEVIRENTYELKEDIQRVWPVKTGASKAGWKVAGHARGWTVYNHVVSPEGFDYVPALWNGSSQQLPLGGDPIVQRRRLLLLKSLRKMQFNAKTGGTAALRRSNGSSFNL